MRFHSVARFIPAFLLVFASALVVACTSPEASSAAGAASARVASGVVEESAMSRVLAEAGPDSLVVFDIDNTLLTPCGHLGSDEWYDYLCERGVARGLSAAEAGLRADEAFNRWQSPVGVRSVDPLSPAVLAKLRERGIPYFALTARSAGVREITLRQLASLDLGMTRGGFAPGDSAKPGAISPHTAFQGGVFFVGEDGPTKGEALTRILDLSGLKPRRIVFVDDKAKHTRTVDAALSARGVDHVCLRFARKDAEVKAFRKDMANAEELLDGVPRELGRPAGTR